MSCDYLPTEVSGPHYRGNVLDILDADPRDGLPWWLMICHPDCTYLCSSGLHWNRRGVMVDGRPRSELTEEALAFVSTLLNAPVPRIALENPVGCISSRIRKADQMIQPYKYGEDASKRTCLWLKNLPPLQPTGHVEPRWVCCGKVLDVEAAGKYGCPDCHGAKKPLPRWGNQTDSGQNKLGPSDDRWKERARTYQGWADAMASQWTPVLQQAVLV
jgi:hypothetical protein